MSNLELTNKIRQALEHEDSKQIGQATSLYEQVIL